jgi:peptidyl-prolyl cis-trans isomerase D
MRRHRRWLYAFLWIVILGFIVFYIPAFQGADAGSPAEPLGYVGGLPITVGEFQRAYFARRQMYERVYQGRLDAAALKSLGLEEQVFDSLVSERLLELEARRLGLRVGDDELAKSLTSSPELQENGRFIGADELKRRLQLQRLSIADFEKAQRTRLLIEKLESVVAGGVSVSAPEIEREFRRRHEQVRVEYVVADAARFRKEAAVTDEEAGARFESRKESYRFPERRVVAYVHVDPDALRARATVTDRDIEVYYQENKDEFREEEQLCASHILVKVKGEEGSQEGRPEPEARRLAEALLARVQGGADFAALAKKESEDTGSAPQGGDLGCFGRGRMVPEFDNAAFSLEPGQTSELVRTNFGYHIIRVASRREEQVTPLVQVKERIRQTLLAQAARRLAEEQAQSLAAALRKGGSLEQAARSVALTLQKSAPLTRGETAPPLGSPALLARAFELKAGEVDRQPVATPRGAAFIEVLEVQPPRLPELKEVLDKIKGELAEEKALERARQLALDVKSRAAKAGLDKAASAAGLVRKETPALVGRGQALGELGTGAAVEEAAFALAANTLSEPVRVAAGYALLRVLEKKPFDAEAFEKQKASLEASLRETKRNQFFQSYMNAARQRFTVERRPDVFQRIVG